MGELVPQDHGGALYRPAKGETPNPNGRPKKLYTILKEQGFTDEEIKQGFLEVGWGTESDAKAILDNPDAPLRLKGFAQMFIKFATKGDYRYIKDAEMQYIALPKTSVEQKIEQKLVVQIIRASEDNKDK